MLCVQSGRAAPAKFHTELALIYLRMATAGHARKEGDLHSAASGASLHTVHSGLGVCPSAAPPVCVPMLVSC